MIINRAKKDRAISCTTLAANGDTIILITMTRLSYSFNTLLLLSFIAQVLVQADQSNPCADLESQISEVVSGDSGAKCECAEGDNSVEYICILEDACLTSGETADFPYSGTLSSSVKLSNLDQPSYSQITTLNICFDYDEDLYDGANVCHETTPENLGGLGVCSIDVDGTLCDMCEFCNGRDENYQLMSAFDCSNVGGESARVCTSDYTNNTETIIRFLANPKTSTACQKSNESAGSTSNGNLLFIVSTSLILTLPFVLLL